jgi:hypothetical protein
MEESFQSIIPEDNNDMYIKIHDELIPVNSEVMSKLEFFKNILNDVTLENNIIFSYPFVDTDDHTYFNKESFNLLIRCLREEDKEQHIVDPCLQADFICLLDYLATTDEAKKLIVRIKIDWECINYLLESSRIYSKLDSFFDEATWIRLLTEWGVYTCSDIQINVLLKRFNLLGGILISDIPLHNIAIKYAVDNHNMMYDIVISHRELENITVILLTNKREIPDNIACRMYYCHDCVQNETCFTSEKYPHSCIICGNLTSRFMFNEKGEESSHRKFFRQHNKHIDLHTDKYELFISNGILIDVSNEVLSFNLIRSSPKIETTIYEECIETIVI